MLKCKNCQRHCEEECNDDEAHGVPWTICRFGKLMLDCLANSNLQRRKILRLYDMQLQNQINKRHYEERSDEVHGTLRATILLTQNLAMTMF